LLALFFCKDDTTNNKRNFLDRRRNAHCLRYRACRLGHQKGMVPRAIGSFHPCGVCCAPPRVV